MKVLIDKIMYQTKAQETESYVAPNAHFFSWKISSHSKPRSGPA